MSLSNTGHGTVEVLSQLLRDVDLIAAFGGHTVILPTQLVQEHAWFRTTHGVLDSGLCWVSVPAGERSPTVRRGLLRSVLSARLTMLEGLTAAAVLWLRDRTFGGQPIGRMQLVEGTVADIVQAVATSRQILTSVDSDTVLRELSDMLARHERNAMTLFGASGYQRGHLPHQLMQLRFVAESWIVRSDAGDTRKMAA
ncbi:hypothetical protein [Flexivirga oryzae]|uniref:Acyl-CoA dehydrogenase/oxidase C-terminal domain-containing protein n=1 Tax=Flexivirga oryzae TaxID=1794944 RepID=A0A839N6G8_9MICO|nr:hypothetical protein [Flexivirga oryzae]MBB2893340.1 hypothetical protein [Flexivirga oryzae]